MWSFPAGWLEMSQLKSCSWNTWRLHFCLWMWTPRATEAHQKQPADWTTNSPRWRGHQDHQDQLLQVWDLGKLLYFLNLNNLRGVWGDSLTKIQFKVTSAEVVIICPVEVESIYINMNFPFYLSHHGKSQKIQKSICCKLFPCLIGTHMFN